MSNLAITRSNFNDWMVPVFAPANFILVRGEGSRLWDQNEKNISILQVVLRLMQWGMRILLR